MGQVKHEMEEAEERWDALAKAEGVPVPDQFPAHPV